MRKAFFWITILSGAAAALPYVQAWQIARRHRWQRREGSFWVALQRGQARLGECRLKIDDDRRPSSQSKLHERKRAARHRMNDSLFPDAHIPPPPTPPADPDRLPHVHRLLLGYYGEPEMRERWDPLTQFIYSVLAARTPHRDDVRGTCETCAAALVRGRICGRLRLTRFRRPSPT